MTLSTSAIPEYRSHWSELGGPVHWIDVPGPDDATPILAVHGLGASHTNWLPIAPMLAQSRHVYALDLHGHGRTPTAHRDTRVESNQRLVNRFIRDVIGRPVILVGTSMGGLISLHQAAAHPQSVTALVLLSPALPLGGHRWPEAGVAAGVIASGLPGLGTGILRLRRRWVSPREQVEEMMRLAGVELGQVPSDLVDLEVAMVEQRRESRETEPAMERAARSTVSTVLARRRYDEVLHQVQGPVLLIHGDLDRLVPVEAAHRAARLHPSWALVTRQDMGHAPMLEHPRWTADTVNAWLASLED